MTYYHLHCGGKLADTGKEVEDEQQYICNKCQYEGPILTRNPPLLSADEKAGDDPCKDQRPFQLQDTDIWLVYMATSTEASNRKLTEELPEILKERIHSKRKKLYVYRKSGGQWRQVGSSFGEADLTRKKAQEEYNDAIRRRSTGERRSSWKIIEVVDDVYPPVEITDNDMQGYTIIAQN